MGDLTGIVEFIVLLAVLGGLIYWFGMGPFDATIKAWGRWILIGVAFLIIIKVGLPLLGLHVL